MLQKNLLKYPNIKAELSSRTTNVYTLSVYPLLHGFGFTLGNSLRRLMLSSIPGLAVTQVKINDLTHEYQPIDGVVEDAIDVILNLKKLKFKTISDDDTIKISLNKSTAGEVLAKDFKVDGKVEIVDSESYLCYLSKDIDLDIEITLTKGVGYLSTDKIDFSSNVDPRIILVDAVFSPITNVNLNVDSYRVGDRTDYDKLELNFTTDGSIDGQTTLEFVIGVLNDLFLQIGSSLNFSDSVFTKNENDNKADVSLTDVDDNEIDLPLAIVRILNKNGIDTNQKLKEANFEEVKDFPGVGGNEIEEIENYIKTI